MKSGVKVNSIRLIAVVHLPLPLPAGTSAAAPHLAALAALMMQQNRSLTVRRVTSELRVLSLGCSCCCCCYCSPFVAKEVVAIQRVRNTLFVCCCRASCHLNHHVQLQAVQSSIVAAAPAEQSDLYAGTHAPSC
jgi:hypothetical protein